MLYVALLASLVFGVVIAIFAIQNSMIVNVNWMMWNVETSLVLVIIGSAALGFLAASSLLLYSQLKVRYRLYKAESQNQKLRSELEKLQPVPSVIQEVPQAPTADAVKANQEENEVK